MMKNPPAWFWRSVALIGLICVGFLDWITGYEADFFVFYFILVALSAWFLGFGTSMSLAVLAAMVWYRADFLSGHTQLSHFNAVWNTINHLLSFVAMAWFVSRLRQLVDSESKLAEELRQSLAEIKVLEAFLSICCECKKIRDQEGRWQQLEAYISAHSNTKFSHSYCPECFEKAMAKAVQLKKGT